MREFVTVTAVLVLLTGCSADDGEWLAIGQTDSLEVYVSRASIEILGPDIYSIQVRTIPRSDSVRVGRWVLDCVGDRAAFHSFGELSVFSDSSQVWIDPPPQTPLSFALHRVCPIADSLGVPGEEIRWLRVATARDSTEHWLDLGSMRRSSDTANVWFRFTGPTVDSQYGRGSRVLMRAAFACNDQRYRELAFVVHDSTGAVSDEAEAGVFDPWKPVVPQTLGEVWADNACER